MRATQKPMCPMASGSCQVGVTTDASWPLLLPDTQSPSYCGQHPLLFPSCLSLLAIIQNVCRALISHYHFLHFVCRTQKSFIIQFSFYFPKDASLSMAQRHAKFSTVLFIQSKCFVRIREECCCSLMRSGVELIVFTKTLLGLIFTLL